LKLVKQESKRAGAENRERNIERVRISEREGEDKRSAERREK